MRFILAVAPPTTSAPAMNGRTPAPSSQATVPGTVFPWCASRWPPCSTSTASRRRGAALASRRRRRQSFASVASSATGRSSSPAPSPRLWSGRSPAPLSRCAPTRVAHCAATSRDYMPFCASICPIRSASASLVRCRTPRPAESRTPSRACRRAARRFIREIRSSR